MSEHRVVRLPDCFYRPRLSRLGLEMRDVMPWPLAIAYVTDGERVGVEFRDGTVEWLLQPRGVGPFAHHFELRRELLPAQLSVPVDACAIMREIWRENADAFGAWHSAGWVAA